MTKYHPINKALLLMILTLGSASAAQAQVSRTWISATGDDADPCSRVLPCKTWAGAIVNTNVNGEINALDPGGYGPVTITKSVTINGAETNASTLAVGVTGFTILYDVFAGTDTRRSVRIRNVAVQGVDTGINGIRIIGGASATNGSEVLIENVIMDGIMGGTGRGISDERQGGGKLFVHNVTISNVSGTAIAIAPAAGSTRIDATIRNVRIASANFGIVAGSGSRVSVTDSSVSGCTNAGYSGEGPAGASELHVESSVSTNNGVGVQNFGGTTIRLSNNTITYNGSGITGATSSYGNNKIAGNTAAGTAPTAIGAVSNNFGQQ